MPKETPIEKTPKSLSSIIKLRSTQRKFSLTSIPTKKDLEQIIEAGIYAPFPAIGTDRKNHPRKFIVIENGTPAWIEMRSALVKMSKTLHNITQRQNLLRFLNWIIPKKLRMSNALLKESDIYAKMMAQSKGDFANFDSAPYWIVIAEYRHVPSIMTVMIRQAMGHCLQNSWLKATELGMIVQPISVISQMQSNRNICQLLGLEKGKWEWDSFLVGYPEKKQKPAKRKFNLEEDIIWRINEDSPS